MAELTEAGCVAFSHADMPFADTELLWRAMQYASTFGYPLWLRASDPHIGRNGIAHDGEIATRLGLAGIPVMAETIALSTILTLVRHTGVRVHL
jgi:dihydroorotase